MSKGIKKIWSELIDANQVGLLKRIYDPDIMPNVYVTYSNSLKRYGISFSFMKKIQIDISSFLQFKELIVRLMNDESFKGARMLVVELTNPNDIDVFGALCENLIRSISKVSDEKEELNIVLNQLEKWKDLLSKTKQEGLTIQEQQGLYGELFFLRKFLQEGKLHYIKVVRSWLGPNSALRDFHSGKWAVEVKTTSTNLPELVSINGERQLDESLLDKLYLFHLSVEKSKGCGETLNKEIESIRKILKSDLVSLDLFNDLLVEAGYFAAQKDFYENTSYSVRGENCYNVNNQFPRIREKDIMNGVCNVRYSISLAAFASYKVEYDELFKELN